MPDKVPLRLLRAALAATVVLAAGLTAWIVDKALENPEVRLKRPGWLDDTARFDFSFWTPLLVTVVVGAGLVFYVFWRAYRRLRAGEDLYAGRYGRPDGERPRGLRSSALMPAPREEDRQRG